MATKQKIAEMVEKNFSSYRSFIENEQGCSFEKYVTVFANEAAKKGMGLMDAYEEVYAENRYFSSNRNECK